MTRVPREVFAHHDPAPGAADIDEIAADFADDAVGDHARGRVPRQGRCPGSMRAKLSAACAWHARLGRAVLVPYDLGSSRETGSSLLYIDHQYILPV
jgi:hypothetical protein